MFSTIVSVIVSLLEKVGSQWLAHNKVEKADAAQNKDAALSDRDAVIKLHEWTRPE